MRRGTERMKKLLSIAMVLSILLVCIIQMAIAEEALPTEIGSTDDPFQKYDIAPNETYDIVYTNFADNNNFAMYVQNSVQEACEYYGLNLTCLDNNWDPVTSINNVNTAITMGADFVIVYNQSPEANAQISNLLEQAGIPTMSIQTAMAKDEEAGTYEPFFGISNQDCGFLAGEAGIKHAQELWGEDVDVIFYTTGKAGSQMHMERIDGALEGARSVKPDVRTETIYTPNNQATEYSQLVTDYLTSHPDDKIVFWSPNDMTGLAMVQAVRLAGREDDVIYVSSQFDPSMTEELLREDAIVYACADPFPESWGWMIIPRVIELLNDGTPLPDEVRSFNVLLTKDNYYEYYPEVN